ERAAAFVHWRTIDAAMAHFRFNGGGNIQIFRCNDEIATLDGLFLLVALQLLIPLLVVERLAVGNVDDGPRYGLLTAVAVGNFADNFRPEAAAVLDLPLYHHHWNREQGKQADHNAAFQEQT